MKSMIVIEKPIIPQFVADFVERCKQMDEDTILTHLKNADCSNRVLNRWKNSIEDPMLIILLSRKIGYEVGGILYEIPLQNLVDSYGEQQYLTKQNGKYFASNKKHKIKQLFTEKELREEVPKEYAGMAVLFDEKKED